MSDYLYFTSYASRATNLSGLQNPATAALTDWSSPSNFIHSLSGLDGNYSYTSTPNSGLSFTSKYLYGYNFNFGNATSGDYTIQSAISSGYYLDNIDLFIYRTANQLTSGQSITDYSLKLIDDSGNLIGNNKADINTFWPKDSGTLIFIKSSYSFPPSGWGFSKDYFNYNRIISSGFGFGLQIINSGNYNPGSTAYVDLFGITLTYSSGITNFNNNISLFIHGYDSFNDNIPLFLNGYENSSGNIPLYINGHQSNSGNIPLFTTGWDNISGGIPLSIYNPIILGTQPYYSRNTRRAATSAGIVSNIIYPVPDGSIKDANQDGSDLRHVAGYWRNNYIVSGILNNSIPLFIQGISGTFTGNIPLYISGTTTNTISGVFPLFIGGEGFVQTCYGEFYPTTVNTICGSGQTSWVNTEYIKANDNLRATATFDSGGAVSCQLKSFFSISGISTSATVSGVIFNIYKQQNVGDGSVKDLEVYLIENGIVQSGVNYTGGLWGTTDNTPVAYSITTDQNGNALTITDILASGFGVAIRAGTNNFGTGLAQIDAITCTVCANVPGQTNSIPLFLSVSQSISGGLPLFILPSIPVSGNIPLYTHGYDTASGNLPLYTYGYDTVSGSIPLYTFGGYLTPGLPSSSMPLYIAGHLVNSGGITLYLQGDHTYPVNNNLPLYLANYSSATGLDSLQRNIPLFLDSHNFAEGITLYLGVDDIGDKIGQITLFTKGENKSVGGGIPLFLNNSGLHANIPLFVKGLSTGENNPYVNSDGFYPIEGQITLFIKTTEGGSIPLYIGSNYSYSGGIPLYMECNNQFSGSFPLFMKTSVEQTAGIPLYHHGF